MNQNYTTLHKDIGLIQRTNNGWDLWFDNGDTVKAEDFHSLQVGIIIACLTSWNYMNRYGNPTYEVFGNRAYELLKVNKSSMVAYKIQQYFIECLKRMRRVYEIVYLEVSEIPSKPYQYNVEFEVISINNQLVNGEFSISVDSNKSTSYIDFTVYMPFASTENPLIVDVWLKNEYGGGISDEIIYLYINEQFYGIVGKTDDNGYVRVTYNPTELNLNSTIQFRFGGNVDYNPVVSRVYGFKSLNIHFDVDEEGILYLTTTDDYDYSFCLAEIIETVNVSNYFLEHEDVEWQKLYLLPIGNDVYKSYQLSVENGEKVLVEAEEEISITKDFPIKTGDIHLLVKGEENNYLIHIDEHIYYLGE